VYAFNQPRRMIKKIAILLLLIFLVVIILVSDFGRGQTVIYDCSLSEISPDFPIEVKEECRRLRYEMWKKEQEDSKRRMII